MMREIEVITESGAVRNIRLITVCRITELDAQTTQVFFEEGASRSCCVAKMPFNELRCLLQRIKEPKG